MKKSNTTLMIFLRAQSKQSTQAFLPQLTRNIKLIAQTHIITI